MWQQTWKLIKNQSPIVTELFMRGRKLNISLVFISQFYFKMPKDIRLIPKYCFIMNIPSNKELQQRASNHSSKIEFKDFMKLYKDYTRQLFPFFVNGATLTACNHQDLGRTCHIMTVIEKIKTIDNKIG